MNRFAPSLLDKLLLSVSGIHPAATLSLDIEQLKTSVARDIEVLLNARPSFTPDQLPVYPHTARSLLTFGLPDITSLSLASDRDRHRVVQAIARALEDHEPRLTDVEVFVRENAPAISGLCFSIHGKLKLSPSAEPVAFDAVLHPGSNRYAVSSDRRSLAGC